MTADGPQPLDSGAGIDLQTVVGPLGPLPRFTQRQIAVERRLGSHGPSESARLVEAWNQLLGGGMVVDRFAVQWRAAGLRRPGVVAHLLWPRFRTRVGFAVDPPLAHAVVDRLLGHERTPAEARLQVSPVEWGVLTFVIATGLERLDDQVGPLGPWDLTVDRVGPDPFDPTDLGPVITWRWRVQVGPITGSARLWLPESLLTVWLNTAAGLAPRTGASEPPAHDLLRLNDLLSAWRVEAGQILIDPGPIADSLTPGRVVLLDGAPLAGSVERPTGPVMLVQPSREAAGQIAAQLEPGANACRLIVRTRPVWNSTPRNFSMTDAIEPASPDQPARDATNPDTGPAVSITVELGRLNIPLRQLATLEAGDVIELARQEADPVDLTADGRLIARGELIQIDTELGVRIIQTYV